jgi:hypothetical protein
VTGVRYLATRDVDGVGGAVVVVDVIRAFTTAAYALGPERRVDAFDFAMEVERTPDGLRLEPRVP